MNTKDYLYEDYKVKNTEKFYGVFKLEYNSSKETAKEKLLHRISYCLKDNDFSWLKAMSYEQYYWDNRPRTWTDKKEAQIAMYDIKFKNSRYDVDRYGSWKVKYFVHECTESGIFTPTKNELKEIEKI